MKKHIFFLFTICCTQLVYSQTTKQKYNTTPITWFGIDYTQVKLVGAEGFTDPNNIVKHYFKTWNEMVYVEAEKYNVKVALSKSDVKIDLKLVEEKNMTVAPSQLVVDKKAKLDQPMIDQVMAKYDFSSYSGFGALLIAEYYDKRSEEASYICIFFDVNTGEVIFNKRYISSPAGFGFRNYWLKTFYSTLNSMRIDVKKALK